MLPTGSEPQHLSGWPLVQELANWVGLPVDTARAHLRNQNVWVETHDRMPPEVFFAALEADGFAPERLTYLNRPKR